MRSEHLKKHLPTLMNYLEKRRKAAENQLPRHLRPLPRWPIAVQMILNMGIFFTLCYLMLNRDEFMNEAVPALGLVSCLLLMIYTLITALQLKKRYAKSPARRLAIINVWFMGLAVFTFPLSITFFLP